MTVAERGPLLCEPADKLRLETKNGVEQIDYITYLVTDRHIEEVRASHILELHELAVNGIYPCGGQYRNALRRVEIQGSEHEVPHESRVPSLVDELVYWLNENRTTKSALERAAYALWRLNWIHPFAGGNGRTSRALTYLILCADARLMLPGIPTVPTLIYGMRNDYVLALREVDASVRENNEPDLSAMSDFLRHVVTEQLARAIDALATAP